MFEVTNEIFVAINEPGSICFGVANQMEDIHVSCLTTSRQEAEEICDLLNNADTDRQQLMYIIEDIVQSLYMNTVAKPLAITLEAV